MAFLTILSSIQRYSSSPLFQEISRCEVSSVVARIAFLIFCVKSIKNCSQGKLTRALFHFTISVLLQGIWGKKGYKELDVNVRSLAFQICQVNKQLEERKKQIEQGGRQIAQLEDLLAEQKRSSEQQRAAEEAFRQELSKASQISQKDLLERVRLNQEMAANLLRLEEEVQALREERENMSKEKGELESRRQEIYMMLIQSNPSLPSLCGRSYSSSQVVNV